MKRIWTLAVMAVGPLAALPGPAQGRTDVDPCPSAAAGVYDSGALVCGEMRSPGTGDAPYLGVFPFSDYENVNDLPLSELQCPIGDRIPGTGFWRVAFNYNWDWDYYVQGGSWVVWDGNEPYVWPQDGELGGLLTGYKAMTISVRNWYPTPGYAQDVPIPTRVFWHCEKASTDRVAPRPEAGTGGDNAIGGNDNDNALVGLEGDDRLRGRAGEDHLHGGAGNDRLHGGAQDDLIHGRRAADKAIGGNGDDDVLLGKGRDVARGGRGRDQLFDDEGNDELRGGPGNDRFSARDGDRDVIRCGAGTDIAVIDALDETSGCEYTP